MTRAVSHVVSLAVALIVALVGRADAGQKAGVTMPDTLQVGGKQLQLNGMGLREATALKVDVYVAALYLEKVSSDPKAIVGSNQVKHLVLRFVRDVDRGDIVKAWSEGFERNATVQLGTIQGEIDQLNSWMPAFKKGDTLGFTYVPGEGVHVDVNGTHKGVLRGEEFARSLYSIWLGPKPPGGDLKRGLLGRHGAGS